MKRVMKVSKSHEEDRLSTLPAGVLCHILSFLNTKYAVQTSVLSKKWMNLWTSLPDLNFNSTSFSKLSFFDNFIERVLTLRDDSVMINRFNLHRKGVIKPQLLEKVMNYATSHNVQHLEVVVEHSGCCPIPICIFSSKSLRTLVLNKDFCGRHRDLQNPLCFKKLTCLHLESVKFIKSDLFSSCPNLVELTLIDCYPHSLDFFNISAPQLATLTISKFWTLKCRKVVLSTPKLTSFHFSGSFPLVLSTDDLLLIDTVRIDAHTYNAERPTNEEKQEVIGNLINMLKCLHYAKYVTLSVPTVKLLSMISGSLSQRPSPFSNLKSLKLIESQKQKHITLNVPAKVMTYLLENSPHAEIVIEFPRSTSYGWCCQGSCCIFSSPA